MALPVNLRIGRGGTRLGRDGRSLLLEVPDVQDGYAIPHIQSSSDLEIGAEPAELDEPGAELTLLAGRQTIWRGRLDRSRPSVTIRGLAFGEYSLNVRAGSGGGAGDGRIDRIGVGTVMAALGDSITEGYYGRYFERTGWLSAEDFPADAVSRDGRNFPQLGPTTHRHLGGPKCMLSWMTDLNDLLSSSLDRPVFIANEGWGSYKTSDYLKLMREDGNWRQRMQLLRPTAWLVHLGVNDGRAKRPVQEVAADLEAMVDLLVERRQARPGAILLARPCYDYAKGAPEILASYCRAIDELIGRRGLSAGPDLYDAYSRDKARYYGEDPVHPNPEGMKFMAQLWSAAILGQQDRWDQPAQAVK